MKYLEKKVIGNETVSERLKILITSGIHGNETQAVYLTSLLASTADSFPKEMDLDFLIGLNETGLKYNSREYIEHNEQSSDLNRSFGESEDTSKNDIIWAVKRNLLTNTDGLVLDVHSSPHIKNCVTIDYDKDTDFFVSFCLKNNIEFIIRDTSNNQTIKKFANKKSPRALTVELNGMGNEGLSTTNKNKEFLINLINCLPFFKETKLLVNTTNKDLSYLITAKQPGLIVFSKDDNLSSYKKEESIAKLYDYNMNFLEEILAPENGTLISDCKTFLGKDIGLFQPTIEVK